MNNASYIPPRRWGDRTPRRWRDRPAFRGLTLAAGVIVVLLIMLLLTYRYVLLTMFLDVPVADYMAA